MALTRWRKPRKVTLPGGYKIPVKYWSDRKIKANLTTSGESLLLGKDLHGFWDGQKIVINSSDPIWDQADTFAHELLHAVHDYGHWLKETVVGPMMGEAGETIMDEKENE